MWTNVFVGSELVDYWNHKFDKIIADDRDDKNGCITVYRLPPHFRSFFDVLEEDRTINAAGKKARKDAQIIIASYGLVLLHNEKNNDYASRFNDLLHEINETGKNISKFLKKDEDKRYWLTEPKAQSDDDPHRNKIYVGTAVKHFVNDICIKNGYDKYQIIMMLFYLALSKYDFGIFDQRCSYLNDEVIRNLDLIENQLKNRICKLTAAANEFNLI